MLSVWASTEANGARNPNLVKSNVFSGISNWRADSQAHRYLKSNKMHLIFTPRFATTEQKLVSYTR